LTTQDSGNTIEFDIDLKQIIREEYDNYNCEASAIYKKHILSS